MDRYNDAKKVKMDYLKMQLRVKKADLGIRMSWFSHNHLVLMGKNELWEKNDENWPTNGKSGSYYYYYYYYSEFCAKTEQRLVPPILTSKMESFEATELQLT